MLSGGICIHGFVTHHCAIRLTWYWEWCTSVIACTHQTRHLSCTHVGHGNPLQQILKHKTSKLHDVSINCLDWNGSKGNNGAQNENSSLLGGQISTDIGVLGIRPDFWRNPAGQISKQMIAFLRLKPGIRHSCIYCHFWTFISRQIERVRHFEIEENLPTFWSKSLLQSFIAYCWW